MPPPARAISSYGTPVTLRSYSSARQPANGRCVWQSTKPGSTAQPRRVDRRRRPAGSKPRSGRPRAPRRRARASARPRGRGAGSGSVGRAQHLRRAADRELIGLAHRDPHPEPVGGVDRLRRSRRRRGARSPCRGRRCSVRRIRSAARSVPSATLTWPACSERPMPTPPPWWNETHDAPVAVLTSALRIGQSATASRAVAHRLGLALRRGDRAGVEVVAADHDRRLDLAGRDELVEAQAGEVALAVAEPADPRRQPLERDALARQLDPAPDVLLVAEQVEDRAGRSPRCRPGRPTARPSGTGPCPRRTAAGCRRGRSRGRRTRPRRRAPAATPRSALP